jgi:septal ring factor EnvC (AmiA/AmiB activator)
VEQRLAEERARLNALLDRQQSVLETLENQAAAVAAAEAEAKQAQGAVDQAQAKVDDAARDEAAARAALFARERALKPRLLARYRLSQGGTSAILLGADNLGDLLWRRRTLNQVLEGDLVQLRAAKDDAARLVKAREALSARKVELQGTQAELDARVAVERTKKQELAVLLESVRSQAHQRERALVELAQAASRLEALSAHVPLVYTGPYDLEKHQGQLPMPTDGLLEVKYGRVVNPRFNTVVNQKGWDLRAPAGSPVKAVAPGKVVHAGWLRGYGNLLIIDHGKGFFSLYAHLSELLPEAGAEVHQGDLLGPVGDTGSLKGAYLYFELRHHQQPMDPAHWLVPRK